MLMVDFPIKKVVVSLSGIIILNLKKLLKIKGVNTMSIHTVKDLIEELNKLDKDMPIRSIRNKQYSHVDVKKRSC